MIIALIDLMSASDKTLQVANRGQEARRRGRELEALNHLGEAVALARSIINKNKEKTRAAASSSGQQISSKHLWNPVQKNPSFRGESSSSSSP